MRFINGRIAVPELSSRYAVHALEMAAIEENDPRPLVDAIFPSFSRVPPAALLPRDKLIQSFNQAAEVMETHLRRLVGIHA